MVALKVMALVLSLGVDTLTVSVSLGARRVRGRIRIALAFACAEAVMPIIGLVVGRVAGRLVGHWGSWLGGLALLAVAVWMFFFDDDDDDDGADDDDADEDVVSGEQAHGARVEAADAASGQRRDLAGWALLTTALGVSMDELAVGFSLGLVGVPIALTIALIALQAFIFTFLGLTFGARLRRYLGEWAEKAAAVVLALLGVWVIVSAALCFG